MTFQNRGLRFFPFAMVIAVYVLAWFLQANLFLNWDVNWLMLATRRMLNGGTYGGDFFETNPPLILLLYIPPVVLGKLTGMSLALLLRAYLFLLASLSLSLCIGLAQKIFSKQDEALASAFIITLALIFLILPIYEFGQREHLLVILSLPYFLLASLRLRVESFNFYGAALIGLLAGIGFSIKPHFLMALFLVEMFVLWNKRNWLAWMRVETLIMGGTVVLYLVAIFLFFPDYVYFIVPYATRFYYLAQSDPWAVLIRHPLMCFCGFTFLFYLTMDRGKPYEGLSSILLFALVGFLFSYLSQRANLYYHLLPAFSLALLLQVLFFGLLLSRALPGARVYFCLALSGLLIFAFIFFWVNSIWTMLIFFPQVFFCFFSVLFAILLAAAQPGKKVVKVVGSVFLIIAISCLGSYLAQRTSLYPHSFLITLFLLMALFALMTGKAGKKDYPGQVVRSLPVQIFTAVLAVLVFSLPVYFLNEKYRCAKDYKKYMVIDLKALSKAQTPPHSVYFFHTTMGSAFMNIDAAKLELGSRFPFMWPVAGLVNREDRAETAALHQQGMEDKALLLKMIVSDFNKNKPDLVLIDVSEPKIRINNKQFDYLRYFSTNQGFREVWKNYQYRTTIAQSVYYKMAVYERVTGGAKRSKRKDPLYN